MIGRILLSSGATLSVLGFEHHWALACLGCVGFVLFELYFDVVPRV